MQQLHRTIAIAAAAGFLVISPWLAGPLNFGASPAYAAGGGGGGAGGGGGGGSGTGGGGAGGAGADARAAGAHGATTAAAAMSSQTSGLGKATSVVGTTPAADDAQSGFAAAIGAAEGATPSPTLDRGR